MRTKTNFKPYIGRIFEFKNYSWIKEVYPESVLIFDETHKEVMFLDKNCKPTWIQKFYLKPNPLKEENLSYEDTIEETFAYLEQLRTTLNELSECLLKKEKEKYTKFLKELDTKHGEIIKNLRNMDDSLKDFKLSLLKNKNLEGKEKEDDDEDATIDDKKEFTEVKE